MPADLRAVHLVGVAAALQLLGDVLQERGQVLDDRGEFVGLAALRRGHRGCGVEECHGQRLVAALAGDDAEFDALARLECGYALGQHRRVYEDVTAVIAGEKAEALLTVEPLDLAGRLSVLVLVLVGKKR